MHSILLAGDNVVVRAGMRATLDGVEGMAVVAEARDERSLRAALAAKSPDLVVLDMAMPGREFGELIPALKREWPATRFMIVMADAHEMDQMRLEAAGADGIFIMDRALSDLVVAANRALHGLPWLAGSPAQRPTVPAVGEPAPLRDETPTLTRRQRELLRLISNDYDNRAIARALDVSVKTVENHLTALYRTLGVRSRLGATEYAGRHAGLLSTHGLEQRDVRASSADALPLLLVDDNPRYRQQLARMIGKACPDSRMYEAGDTAHALRLTAQVKPWLALVDVVLSDEDGILCGRKIKGVCPTTRLVMISAYPDREFRRLGMAAGAVAFIDKKDIDAATLRQIVEDAQGSHLSQVSP